MHIVIGIEYDMIRIMGQGFVVYVKDIYNFSRFIDYLPVKSASYDESIKGNNKLCAQITDILKNNRY